MRADQNASVCLEACVPGTFAQGLACLQCAAGCTTCNGATTADCQSCTDGYALVGSTCVDHCGAAQYIGGGLCQNCSE